MGIFKQGILGGFRNKVGTVIGSKWRGRNVMRGLPDIDEDRVPTQPQLDQRLKFGLITSLLAWVSDVVGIGYRSSAKVPTPMNVAVSENLKVAVTGVSPNYTVDPTKLKFSKGRLSLPSQYTATAAEDAVLEFTWMQGIAGRFSHVDDAVHLLVYNPEKQRFASAPNAALRSAGEYTMQLPLDWIGDVVHSYMCFSEPKEYGIASSDSQYIGMNTLM